MKIQDTVPAIRQIPCLSVSKNYRSCHCDVVAVGDEGALRIRPLRLPVGAKRRGNLKQEVPNSPKSYKIFKQFCEIATAASGLAMTKSDFFDNLSRAMPGFMYVLQSKGIDSFLIA